MVSPAKSAPPPPHDTLPQTTLRLQTDPKGLVSTPGAAGSEFPQEPENAQPPGAQPHQPLTLLGFSSITSSNRDHWQATVRSAPSQSPRLGSLTHQSFLTHPACTYPSVALESDHRPYLREESKHQLSTKEAKSPGWGGGGEGERFGLGTPAWRASLGEVGEVGTCVSRSSPYPSPVQRAEAEV